MAKRPSIFGQWGTNPKLNAALNDLRAKAPRAAWRLVLDDTTARIERTVVPSED